jgi:molybdopterin converting factor small subunit
LRPYAGGATAVQAEGATVGEVLGDLTNRFPGIAGQVWAEEGKLNRFVNVYLNDDDVRYLDQLDTKVHDSDAISILPAVAGGSGAATVGTVSGSAVAEGIGLAGGRPRPTPASG